jgi:hypothetical protein
MYSTVFSDDCGATRVLADPLKTSGFSEANMPDTGLSPESPATKRIGKK